jgi:hypothetical protein
MVALCVVVMGGCGGSPADQAAQEMYDLMLEAKELKDSGDMAKAMEMLGRMVEAAQKLEKEMKKMSPEERKAFIERWDKKFKAAGLDGPSGD